MFGTIFILSFKKDKHEHKQKKYNKVDESTEARDCTLCNGQALLRLMSHRRKYYDDLIVVYILWCIFFE